ncbi:hypothetical protein K438DRAFT_2013566 [Mycena galopus ATCC 62051]|nr:hypothetical protein K438DRAFT_2013566 [Mycena galopus ATCC 62051]
MEIGGLEVRMKIRKWQRMPEVRPEAAGCGREWSWSCTGTWSAAGVEEQPVPATPDPSSVFSIPRVFGGTGGLGGAGGGEGGVGGAGGPGYGPSFHAGNITINNCQPEHERLEQSNIRLDTDVRDLHAEVRVLRTEVRSLDNQVRFRTVVLFGLSPVSRGYLSGCAGAL